MNPEQISKEFSKLAAANGFVGWAREVLESDGETLFPPRALAWVSEQSDRATNDDTLRILVLSKVGKSLDLMMKYKLGQFDRGPEALKMAFEEMKDKLVKEFPSTQEGQP